MCSKIHSLALLSHLHLEHGQLSDLARGFRDKSQLEPGSPLAAHPRAASATQGSQASGGRRHEMFTSCVQVAAVCIRSLAPLPGPGG